MEKILVPVDFSKTSEMAMNFALQLAKRDGSSITLLHALTLPVDLEPTLMDVSLTAELTDRAFDEVEEKLKNLCSMHQGKCAGMEYFVRAGSLMKVINEYGSLNHFDIIVMGTHGASGFREIFIGSNAEKVIRKAKVPVFTIPNLIPLDKINTLLIPLDIEDLSDGFLHSIKELIHFFGAKPYFVHIDTPSAHINDEQFMAELEEILDHRGFSGYEIKTGRDFTPESGIFHALEELKADMICVATHGKVGLSHILEGSLAEDIANHSRVPVWTYNLKMEEHFENRNLAYSI